jgi:heme exporter protein D
MMALGSYASFIATSYLAAVLAVLLLVCWITLDYRSLTRRLRELNRDSTRCNDWNARDPR